jgi:hypothetical protein
MNAKDRQVVMAIVTDLMNESRNAMGPILPHGSNREPGDGPAGGHESREWVFRVLLVVIGLLAGMILILVAIRILI